MNGKRPEQTGNWKMFISRMLSLGLSREHLPIIRGADTSSDLYHAALIRDLIKNIERNPFRLDVSLADMEVVILDTETTGFRPEHDDEIISIAAAKTACRKVTADVFSTYVKPSTQIPESITALTGITQQEVAFAPTLHEVMPDLLKFINGRMIAGYHIAHDLAFLNTFLWKHHRTGMSRRLIELRKVMEALWPGHLFRSLDDVLSFFSIEIKNRHTALGDVKMTELVWHCILEECERQRIHTLEDLYVRMSNQ
jgi:DNA polymerase III subunit epsilon